jgi:ABC-type Zn uptake system ZnuABC Zn-binding protein ZnuA
MTKFTISLGLLAMLILAACQPGGPATATGGIKVLVVETFLADITRNVAGSQASVDTLIPPGLDPHAFEPAPRDVARIAESQVLVINGAGYETWLQPVLANVGGQRQLVIASAGLKSRAVREDELAQAVPTAPADSEDPHFWLDPLNVVYYVENIRDGLVQADPAGKDSYTRNAEAYIVRLTELDGWIQQQVSAIPPARRLLVTNHESLGYFADRYGFKVAGTIIPSVTSGASPSAQELARLVDQIRAVGAKAIFLEVGSNAQLAEQVAGETGVKVVTDLYTESITSPDGPAPTYLEMMKANVMAIVNALK